MSEDVPQPTATAKPMSLREEQRALTRTRILEALAELIESHHPLDVTMAAVAERAGVSEPTLYRHFDTKRNLFKALGSELYRQSTAGAPLNSLDDLLGFLPALYEQFLPILQSKQDKIRALARGGATRVEVKDEEDGDSYGSGTDVDMDT